MVLVFTHKCEYEEFTSFEDVHFITVKVKCFFAYRVIFLVVWPLQRYENYTQSKVRKVVFEGSIIQIDNI